MAATQQSVIGRSRNELELTDHEPLFLLLDQAVSLVDWRTYLHAYASSSLPRQAMEDSVFVGPNDPYEQSSRPV
jgi:hypothetical protein